MRSAIALLTAAALAAGPAAAHRDHPEPRAAADAKNVSVTPWLPVIGKAAEIALIDTDANRVSLRGLRGQVVLVSFIYTQCTTACPLLTYRMARLQKRLREARAERVQFLSITVDPARDTARVLADYAARFGIEARQWRFLRDEPQALAPVLAAYGEWTRRLADGDLDHPARLFLVDARGDLREIYSLAFFDEGQAFHDIRALLREARD